MSNRQNTTSRKAMISKAWWTWFLMFVPLFGTTLIAARWYGFFAVFPLLLVVLAITLIYQRRVNKRTWHSIMWGVYARKE